MIVETADRTAPAVWATPVGAEFEGPPIREIAQIDRSIRRIEDERTCLQHVRQRAGIIRRVRRYFGEGDIAGRPDEVAKPPVRHRRAIHPESIDRDAMDWRSSG